MKHHGSDTARLSQTKQDPNNGGHWAAECAMQWFNILESIDYNYTFFWLECTATPVPWNGIKDTYTVI